MVSVLASSAIDCEFDPRSGQTKEYKIGICCFSAKHAALRSKSKDWLARNQNNVSEWSDISTRQLALWKSNWACWSRTKRTSSSSHWKLTCSRRDIAENCWIGVKQLSLTHGSVMVSVRASSAIDCGFEPRSGQTKNIQLVSVASPLRTQQ